MKKFKELSEQHREKGRFHPVKPYNVSNLAAASPRSSSDSASAKLKEEKKDKYDEGEYDQEGDMAKSDLRSIMANAKELHDMIDDADNLPEWCQNKITLAEDYISTVTNYMTAEMNEGTYNNPHKFAAAEIKAGTFKSYSPTASMPAKEKTVMVRHKTSGKELVVTVSKAKELQKHDYHPVKEEVEQHKEIYVHTEVEDGSHQDKNDTKNLHDRVKAAAKKHGATITYQDRPSLRGSHSIAARGSHDFHKEVKHIASDYEHLGAQHEVFESVEQIDELSNDTLKSYLQNRKDQEGTGLGRQGAGAKHQYSYENSHRGKRSAINRLDARQGKIGKYGVVPKIPGYNKEEVNKADVPAYLRKQKGEKPLTMADVKAPRKDSISAKENLAKARNEEVEQIDEKNVPTNPELWSRAKALARSKFDVYPSAYANGWASKWYKGKGGSWKSVSEAKEEPPFNKPYTTVKKVVTDKSGAKHGPMSRARDIARMAMKKQMEKMKPVKESLEESRKAEIVKEIMKKKKDKSEDAFQKDPELTTTLTKGI